MRRTYLLHLAFPVLAILPLINRLFLLGYPSPIQHAKVPHVRLPRLLVAQPCLQRLPKAQAEWLLAGGTVHYQSIDVVVVSGVEVVGNQSWHAVIVSGSGTVSLIVQTRPVGHLGAPRWCKLWVLGDTFLLWLLMASS